PRPTDIDTLSLHDALPIFRDRQQVPRQAIEIRYQGEVLRLDREMCVRAREKARRSRRPHNQARPIFVREIVNALARQVAGRLRRSEEHTSELQSLTNLVCR